MTITKREILFSVIILFVLLAVGFFIGEKIQDSTAESAEFYLKAVQITDPEQFNYGMKTNIGNALVYGEFEAVAPVSLPELQGDFFYIEKITERYTMKTRTVTETDSDGNTTTRIETYYEWDRINRDSWAAESFTFMESEHPAGKISIGSWRLSLDDENATGNISWNYIYAKSSFFHSVGDLRYYYNYTPTSFSGTILATLKDGTFYNHTAENKPVSVEYEREIAQVVESAKNAGKVGFVVFWVVWILLTGGAIFGFVYLDNHWLESHKRR